MQALGSGPIDVRGFIGLANSGAKKLLAGTAPEDSFGALKTRSLSAWDEGKAKMAQDGVAKLQLAVMYLRASFVEGDKALYSLRLMLVISGEQAHIAQLSGREGGSNRGLAPEALPQPLADVGKSMRALTTALRGKQCSSVTIASDAQLNAAFPAKFAKRLKDAAGESREDLSKLCADVARLPDGVELQVQVRDVLFTAQDEAGAHKGFLVMELEQSDDGVHAEVGRYRPGDRP